MGALFKVHNKLGNSYQEKYYQRAVAKELKLQNISFIQEFEIKLDYEEESIGKYFLDFLIEEKIILETKAEPIITLSFQRQVLAYLKSTNLKLGIIANFRTPRLTYCRLVNPHVTVPFS